MSEKKMPDKNSLESKEFLAIWDNSNHTEKLNLCNLLGVSYSRAKHVVPSYRVVSLVPPEYEDTPDIKWEEQVDILKSMDRLVAQQHYTPSEVTVKIDTDKPIALVKTADWHLGMFGVDYDSFREDVITWRDEDGLFLDIGGDGYHNVIQPSKMGSAHNQVPISVQRGLFVQVIKELRKKIKTIKTGNHNYWSTLAVGEDWEREFARRLKLVYLKHSAKVYWKVGDFTYPELMMHKGRFNSSFNLTHACKQYQRMYFPEARMITIEHQHTAAVEQYRYNDNECVAIRTGTYGVYDDYAQQNGYYGSHVCNPTVIMFPDRDKLIAFKDMGDAITHLRAVRNTTD